MDTSVDDVKKSFEYYDLGGPHVYYEKELVIKDTLPLWKDKDIPIAALSCGSMETFYDSYQDAMYFLYDKVSIGGIIIFDNVLSSAAVRRFLRDFKNEKGEGRETELGRKISASPESLIGKSSS
jgi:hypothetical protein